MYQHENIEILILKQAMRRLKNIARGGVEGVSKTEVNEKNNHHRGLWKETVSRPPPQERRFAERELCYDYGYIDRVCI